MMIANTSISRWFAPALMTALGLATPAIAEVGPSPVTLGPTTVYVLGAGRYQPVTAPGVYDFTPEPGLEATGDSNATALFGADPMVSANYDGNDGAIVSMLTYEVELVPPGGPPASPPNAYGPGVAVPFFAADVADGPGYTDPYVGRADALIEISNGPAQALYMENCAQGLSVDCSYGGGSAFTTTPFSAVHDVNLVPGVDYTVELRADVMESGFAEVDPTFTAPAGYTLAFSPGVGSVPEPGTWAMMVLGMGVLGFALRKQSPRLVLARA